VSRGSKGERETTDLSGRRVGCDEKLDLAVSKNAENDAHEVPLVNGRRALKQANGLVDPALLVALPGFPPKRALPGRVDAAPRRRSTSERETRRDEDGLDPELLKRAQVGLNEGRQCRRKSARRRDEGLARRR
jgi:hypothetical protein